MTNEVANVNGNETQKLEIALKKVSAVGDRAREIARVADEVRDGAGEQIISLDNAIDTGKRMAVSLIGGRSPPEPLVTTK